METLRDQRKQALAESVSETGNVHKSADAIGISRGYARAMWAEIKRDLGSQAV